MRWFRRKYPLAASVRQVERVDAALLAMSHSLLQLARCDPRDSRPLHHCLDRGLPARRSASPWLSSLSNTTEPADVQPQVPPKRGRQPARFSAMCHVDSLWYLIDVPRERGVGNAVDNVEPDGGPVEPNRANSPGLRLHSSVAAEDRDSSNSRWHQPIPTGHWEHIPSHARSAVFDEPSIC